MEKEDILRRYQELANRVNSNSLAYKIVQRMKELCKNYKLVLLADASRQIASELNCNPTYVKQVVRKCDEFVLTREGKYVVVQLRDQHDQVDSS